MALAYIAVRDALYPFAWLPCRPAHPLNLIPADAMVTGVWRIASKPRRVANGDL